MWLPRRRWSNIKSQCPTKIVPISHQNIVSQQQEPGITSAPIKTTKQQQQQNNRSRFCSKINFFIFFFVVFHFIGLRLHLVRNIRFKFVYGYEHLLYTSISYVPLAPKVIFISNMFYIKSVYMQTIQRRIPLLVHLDELVLDIAEQSACICIFVYPWPRIHSI